MIKNRETISAFIVCCNEAHQIRRCLDSVKFCDEIIVVDSGSNDQTLEICAEYPNVKIFKRPWQGYLDQKRFALSQCSSKWIYNIDCDEEVTAELAQEIIQILQKPSKFNGYYNLRTIFHLGKWWLKGGWFPEYRIRLARREFFTYEGLDPHERVKIQGAVGCLNGQLRHYTYSGLYDQVESLIKFAHSSARAMHQAGRKASIIKILFNPLLRFVKFYFFKKGFLEGMPGLLVAISESYYVFLKYALLWELQNINYQQNENPELNTTPDTQEHKRANQG